MEELGNETIQRASKGDRDAFRELYTFYAPFVWRLVYRTAGGDEGSAREILQETFVRIHGSLKKFGFQSAFSTWVYRIAFNASLNILARRNRANHHSFNDELSGTGQWSDRYESKEIINKIMSSLSSEERFLLIAREVDGLSFEQIADATGKNSGALRTKLHRIKEEIRRRFNEGKEYAA